jgi:hypothetical protein
MRQEVADSANLPSNPEHYKPYTANTPGLREHSVLENHNQKGLNAPAL